MTDSVLQPFSPTIFFRHLAIDDPRAPWDTAAFFIEELPDEVETNRVTVVLASTQSGLRAVARGVLSLDGTVSVHPQCIEAVPLALDEYEGLLALYEAELTCPG